MVSRHPDDSARTGSASSVPHRSRWHYAWASIAALLTACGVAGAVLAAGSVAHSESDRAQKSFQRSSARLAANLQLGIAHEADLTADVGGLLAGDGTLTQSAFDAWADTAHLLQRYPEMGGIAALTVVSRSALPAFAERAEADPAGVLAANGTFAVTPAGVRPFYCLVSVSLARGSKPTGQAGLDYCADPTTSGAFLGARDSGLGVYLPYQSGGHTWLGIQTPIYRGGLVPTSVRARRAAFVGWVGTEMDPTVLLDRALLTEPGFSVTMRYHGAASDVVFTAGHTPAGARSVTTAVANGWAVQTFSVVDGAGVGSGNPLKVLIGGILVSVLLGLLVFVLGTGRERARRLVEQRTGQLRHQALHDALTGLPNRALVMDRLEQLLVRDRRTRSAPAALFIDLDDFKNVNDTLGHGAGDRLLIAVAARLASTLRGADTIGRMGGDEFVVLLDNASTDTAPELVARRMIDVMRRPFDIDGAAMPLMVSISVGIATGDRARAEDLLRDADVALYQSKSAGKNRYETYRPEMQTTISRRTDLEFDLRSALSGDQYWLAYQPIYNLDDLTVVGVEALLRWNHPTDGVIAPDEFIPILEQTGQIRDVGRWVLQTACKQMATWHAHGDTLDVSVNVSGRQLDHDGIVDDIRDALRTSGLQATSLIIEITETALMKNVEATARRLHAIKDLGVRVAVDDFGTGYSSLAYLRQFPVDCLKIDRMFTNAIASSPESKALVGTLVQLGKDLGLRTLAEGVETTEEMDLLRGAHVNQIQGFLMARPLGADDIEAQLLAPIRPTTTTTPTP